MSTTGEPAPWNIAGWGGGGSAIAQLVSNHFQSIKSATHIEAYPPGIESNYFGYQNGLDLDGITAYRSSQLASRLGIAQLILFLAIPWVLMSLFFPLTPQDSAYYPPSHWTEFRVQLWKSKSWISQLQGIQHMQTTPDSSDPLYGCAPLPTAVPVFGVYCNVTATCFDGFANQTSQACLDIINQNIYYNTRKFNMVRSLYPNATFVNNSQFDCALSLPLKDPLFTATAILKLYSTIRA
jgi:hypothetical protein